MVTSSIRSFAKFWLVLLTAVSLVILTWVGYMLFIPRVRLVTLMHEINQSLPQGTSRRVCEEWISSNPTFPRAKRFASYETKQDIGLSLVLRDTGPKWGCPEEIQINFYFIDDILVEVEGRRTVLSF